MVGKSVFTATARPAELGSCGDPGMRFLVVKNKMKSLPKMVIKDRCLGAIMTVRRDIEWSPSSDGLQKASLPFHLDMSRRTLPERLSTTTACYAVGV
jgi:hypothetical protein